MSLQYLRQASLIVAKADGSGLELGTLRIMFNTRRGDQETPNVADIRVYNLAQTTANLFGPKTEFVQAQLQVAYQGQQLQTIFTGTIKQARLGREDQKNSYVDLTVADGDEAYNFSYTAQALAAGGTPQDSISALIQSMATGLKSNTSPTTTQSGGPATVPPNSDSGQAISATGLLPLLPTTPSTRGQVFYGPTRMQMRKLVADANCKWSIQDGVITVIPQTGFIPEPPVLITPSTGLIGIPEQTGNGLQLKVLLNPNIKIGRRIQLLSTDINLLRYDLNAKSNVSNEKLALYATKLNADGLYYVMRADHTGDTRGTTWYTELTCLAVDATIPEDINLEQAILPAAAAYPIPVPRD